MADNVNVAGVGNISTDDVTTLNGATVTAGTAQTQRVKLQFGDDGTARDASAAFPLPVAPTPAAATGTLTSVTASATSVTLLAANANRKGALIYNDSTSTLAVAFASSASLTAFTVEIPAAGLYELPAPNYTGIVTGIWAAANGSARVTELT